MGSSQAVWRTMVESLIYGEVDANVLSLCGWTR